MTLANDINLLSAFLSHDQTQLPPSPSALSQPYAAVILCVSAIIHCSDTLFTALRHHVTSLTTTLILCGGIGHSTPHLYNAIGQIPRYKHLSSLINGKPEAQVMEIVLDECFDGKAIREKGVNVLVEDQSTNCGANATETRKLLLEHGALGRLKGGKVLVIQDPTMSLRTKMSFEKAFANDGVGFLACPTFVPKVEEVGGELRFVEGEGVKRAELWDMDRFLGLCLGEIVRLRDDEEGYGPKGKGFIEHVDVPGEVLEAYARLEKVVHAKR